MGVFVLIIVAILSVAIIYTIFYRIWGGQVFFGKVFGQALLVYFIMVCLFSTWNLAMEEIQISRAKNESLMEQQAITEKLRLKIQSSIEKQTSENHNYLIEEDFLLLGLKPKNEDIVFMVRD